MRKQKSRRSPRVRRKSGSIMIMVVALLVLMALLGTAYIATARYDRGSAMQNSDNVQIDILMNSVETLCKTAVSGDLWDGNGNYRPVPRNPFDNTNNVPSPNFLRDSFFYYNVTSTGMDTNLSGSPERIDYWLSDRTPNFGKTQANNLDHYYWGRVSEPLTTEMELVSSVPVPVRGYFEDPTYVKQNASDPLLLRFRFDTDLEPTSKPVNGTLMPAFNIKITGLTPNPYTALAADADGDGIADSFLVRMPIGAVNGVTYYYAVRIIDNTAAININTALGDSFPMSNNDGNGGRLFPTSINLDEQFGGATPAPFFTHNEANSIHAYRTQRKYTTGKLTSLTAQELLSPLPDWARGTADARTDFGFLDEHDAFWTQMARRPENPGFIPSNNTLLHYRPFPLSDLISLVPHFVLAPPNSSSMIDSTLSADIPGTNDLSSGTKPYAANNLVLWGNDNFNYTNNVYCRRPLVVTSNSVSTAISPHFMPKASTDTKDFNDDGNLSDDVAGRGMLDYSVASNHRFVINGNANWPPRGYGPHDYIQLDFGGGVTLNYAFARSSSSTTTTSPLSSTGSNFWEFIPNLPDGAPMKTSLNTAGFRELYRSYWNVICNERDASMTPYGTNAAFDPYADANNTQRQFRSSIRDIYRAANPAYGLWTLRFPPRDQMLLRAALAAVNTIDLRDSDDDVTSRTIVLNAFGRDQKSHPVEVTLFGSEPQPFITEVYANTDNATKLPDTDPNNGQANPKGYVAIELFNPYDHDISLKHWQLALVDRRRVDSAKNIDPTSPPDTVKHKLRPLFSFADADIIKAKSYLVLHNHPTGNTTDKYPAKNLPPNVTVTGTPKYVHDLYKVFEDKDAQSTTNGQREVGGELVILRPRRADGTYTSQSLPYNHYAEQQTGQVNLYDLIPVDQFDFSGLQLEIAPGPASGNTIKARSWHYVRQNSDSGDNRWKCVYPGHYRAGKPNYEDPRHDFDPSPTWDAPRAAGVLEPSQSYPIKLGAGDASASYTNNFLPIQISNLDFGGPNPIQGITGNKFPFGGFQRVGDVMQVPFMGAYRIRELHEDASNNPAGDTSTGGYALINAPEVFLELNSLPMDCSFADDSVNADDQFENIGRFCPILDPNYPYYDFGRRIFDYFTVIAPNEDYFPNVNPDRTPDATRNNTSIYRYLNGQYQNIMGATSNYPNQHADPVKNIDSGSSAEPMTGIHGLININTANWKVLSMVPFTANAAANAKIAKGIVAYRDGDPTTGALPQGPFTSLFDLYNVPEFTANQPVSNDPDDDEGDFSPYNPTLPNLVPPTDGVTKPFEFEKQYLLITRISNLLTTRSDSFTAYILVQGWRNPNTPQAELVVQRRAAMLIDRSGVTKDNREPRTMLIPVE